MTETVTRIVIDGVVLHFSSKAPDPAHGHYNSKHETYDTDSKYISGYNDNRLQPTRRPPVRPSSPLAVILRSVLQQ